MYQVSVSFRGAGVCPAFHSTDHVVHSQCRQLDEVHIRKYSCSALRTPSALSCHLPSPAPGCPFLAWAVALIQGLSSCLFSSLKIWNKVQYPCSSELLRRNTHIYLFSKYIFSRVFFNFYFYFILLYNSVLVLPYIDMNPPRVYMSSQS